MTQRHDDGLARRAAIAVAAIALAVGAWSEIERTRSRTRAADLARQLAQVEAALAGRPTPAAPAWLAAHGARFEVAVDAFGARATAGDRVGERP